jgi:hypothetical protein
MKHVLDYISRLLHYKDVLSSKNFDVRVSEVKEPDFAQVFLESVAGTFNTEITDEAVKSSSKHPGKVQKSGRDHWFDHRR